MCDDQCIKGLAADLWIRGWERPIQKLIMKAIVADRPSSSDLTAVFDDFFAQVKKSLDARATGPEAFNQLLNPVQQRACAKSPSAATSCWQSLALVASSFAILWARLDVAALMASLEASSSKRCWSQRASSSMAYTFFTVSGAFMATSPRSVGGNAAHWAGVIAAE